MLKRGVTVVVAVVVLLGLSGCVLSVNDGRDHGDSSDWQDIQAQNRLAIAKLDLGLNRSAVIDRLGEPDFSEAFNNAGVAYQVLYYRTQRTHGDGKTTKDETTPLIFKASRLFGWGQSALNLALGVAH